MASFLDKFCQPGDAAALATVCHALLTVFPEPTAENEFTRSRHGLAPLYNTLLVGAAASRNKKLDLSGEEEAEPVLATLKWVAHTQLFPDYAGYRARRYLAALFVERLADTGESSDALDLGMTLRAELKAIERNPTSKAPIPDHHSLLDFTSWMDDQRQGSERFPGYFWAAWKRSLAAFARNIVFRPFEEPPSLDQEHGTFIAAANEEVGDEGGHPDGGLAPNEVEELLEKFKAGTRSTILQSTLSTVTPLSAFSEASNTVMSDEEARTEVQRLVQISDRASTAGDSTLAEAAIGRLLVVSTATQSNQVHGLVWGDCGDPKYYPGVISLDAEWLLRPELRPEGAAKGVEERGGGVVWIPIPRSLGLLLKRLHPAPAGGDFVLPALKRSGSDSALQTHHDVEAPSLTALRHTLLSRLARSEPLGLTGAQLVAGDSLGVSLIPLYYDRYPADRLAQIVERVVSPWFSERVGGGRKARPHHMLGARVSPDILLVQSFFRETRRVVESTSDNLLERIRARMDHVVHGLAAFSGHRASDTFGQHLLVQFGMPDPVAVIADKKVAPDWRYRPIITPSPWQRELAALMADLQTVIDTHPGTELSVAAAAALSSTGPIFLDVRSMRDVKPYCRSTYLRGLPAELQLVPNFARHLLNVRLINISLPEALRVAQLGWHGTREGAWANGSPWSVLDVAARLEKPLSDHLKNLGWTPSRDAPILLPDEPVSWTDWCELERAHRREFGGHVTQLKRAMAAKHAEMAIAMAGRARIWLSHNEPKLTMDQHGHFAFSSSAPDQKPIPLSGRQLAKIEHSLSEAAPRSLLRAVGRNWLSALCRRGRGASVVSCQIPRRVIWQFPFRAGAFSPSQPSALRAAREVDRWLCSAANHELGTTMSEYAIAACAMILHGAHRDPRLILAALSPRATLHRARTLPAILIVNLASGEEPSLAQAGDWSAEAWNAATRSIAFHGLAALHLLRWHSSQDRTLFSEEEVAVEIFSQLPPNLRPLAASNTLEHLAALAAACRALDMDGVARLVGSGVVVPTCIEASRAIAVWDGTVAPYGGEMRSPVLADTVKKLAGPTARPTTEGLYAAMSKALASVKADRGTETAEREQLTAKLIAWWTAASERTVQPIDLLVRLALALLQRGGRKKGKLQLSTIVGYVYSVGRPLLDHLPASPLKAADTAWQEAFVAMIASLTPSSRRGRLEALRTFHWVLTQEMDIPEVEFGPLETLAGEAPPGVDAGLFTSAELDEIATGLATDLRLIRDQGASQADTHAALARELAFHLMASAPMRTGETYGLRLSDTSRANSSGIRIRASRYLGLKSVNARRRIKPRGQFSDAALQLLSTWRTSSSMRRNTESPGGGPLFLRIENESSRLVLADVFARTGQLARSATGLRGARLYWLRKTGAFYRISRVQQDPATSLWPIRDFVAEMGQGSITVSLRSYIHDPISALVRWFQSTQNRFDIARLTIAAGGGRWRAIRRNSGADRARSARNGSERIASMLAPIHFDRDLPIHIPVAETLIVDSTFSPSHGGVDNVLRLHAQGNALKSATSSNRWPPAACARLDLALGVLASTHGLVLSSEPTGEFKQLVPPRQIELDGGLSAFLGNSQDQQVLLEMANAWVSHEGIPGQPPGIPALATTWTDWETRLPGLAGLQWNEVPWGAMRVRTPRTQGRISAFPLLRWGLVVILVRNAVMSGNEASSDDELLAQRQDEC